MKKIAAVWFIIMFLTNTILPALGEEPATEPPQQEAAVRAEAKGDPLTKFGRGLCNLVTFYIEIPVQSKKVKDKSGDLAGMTYGLGKGLAMAGMRAFVAVYEITTFLIPYPAGYKPILTDPVSFFPESPKKQA